MIEERRQSEKAKPADDEAMLADLAAEHVTWLSMQPAAVQQVAGHRAEPLPEDGRQDAPPVSERPLSPQSADNTCDAGPGAARAVDRPARRPAPQIGKTDAHGNGATVMQFLLVLAGVAASVALYFLLK